MSALFSIILALLAIFLILLVLVQRGRGGGLAGALGGMGGSSAFGAKAGDVFTRITVVVVAIWITICIIANHWAKNRGDPFGTSPVGTAAQSQTQDQLTSGPKFPLPPGEEKDKAQLPSVPAGGGDKGAATTQEGTAATPEGAASTQPGAATAPDKESPPPATADK
jgi:preprotein translocase subunit SecG